MRKAFPIAALLLVVGAAAFVFFQKRQAETRVRATALAPAETVFFVHLPDIRQSAIRWPKTSLAQIGREPEVQAFLEKPRQKLSWMNEMATRLEQLTHAAPREAYLAVTSVEGTSTPKFVGGFSFSGSRAAVDELVGNARAAIRKAWPAGKADIISYAGAEIETYSDKDNVIAETIRDGWYLVSNQVDLLEATLDRLDGKPGAGAPLLRGNLYQETVKPQPADADGVVFARLDVIAERLVPLLAGTGQQPSAQQLAEMRKTKALSAALRFDGEQIRDTVFILNPDAGSHAPLARRGLDLSTAETLLYYVATVPETVEMPGQTALPLSMLLPALANVEHSLADKGMKFSDFGTIFGPEFSVLLDWPPTEMQPSFVLGFDVRDSVRARAFLDAVASTKDGTSSWSRKEQDEALIYSAPPQGFLPGPVVALAQNFLILAFSEQTATSGLERLKAKAAPLGKTPEYETAASKVAVPTEAFGYLDTKRLFERSYGIMRPLLAMTIAFSPDSGQYIDAGKLPTTEAVSRHLTPSVYTQTTTAQGTLIESAGTLTFNQAIVGVVAGSVMAALPSLKQGFPGTQGLPAGVLPPGAVPPALSPVPVVPQVKPPDAPSPQAEVPPAVQPSGEGRER